MVNMRPKFDFTASSGTRRRGWGLLLLIVTGLAFGCQNGPNSPELNEAETQLVAELVQLHRLQILEGTQPATADSLRGELRAILDGPSLDERIRLLGEDPARGAVLLRAVRDSLASMRQELFGTSTASNKNPPRPRTPSVSPAEPAEGERDD
jgi:hypothetical protein